VDEDELMPATGLKMIGAARTEVYGRRDVNVKTAGPTLLATSDGERYFVPREVGIVSAMVTGHGSAAVLSIGTNAPDYDDLLSSVNLANLNGSAKVKLAKPTGDSLIPPGTDIFVNITVPAVATVAIYGVGIDGLHF
jgi:hypothetical protein